MARSLPFREIEGLKIKDGRDEDNAVHSDAHILEKVVGNSCGPGCPVTLAEQKLRRVPSVVRTNVL